MRKAGSLPVPGKPHHAALGTSIRTKGGEMSEERSLKQVSMALGNLRIEHLRNPFSVRRPTDGGSLLRVKRCTNASAAPATSRQPLSMVSVCPRPTLRLGRPRSRLWDP
jgi:hypothetical protein